MKENILRNFKKRMSGLLAVVVLLCVLLQATVITAQAASIDISGYWGSSAATHSYTISTSGTVDLTALSGTDAGNLTLTVDSGASVAFKGDASVTYTNLSIVIAGGADITLDNVSIDNTAWSTSPVVAFDENSSNTLHFSGTNTLRAPSNCAAIFVEVYEYGAKLCNIMISGADDSSVLNAYGGSLGVGIGSKNGTSTGKITITGGTVYANGSGNGAGIGGGDLVSGGTVTITGGTVYATGGTSGAGIGGGDKGSGGTVTITGGTVNATGNKGAGIGGGAQGSGGTVIITGGTVSATSSNGAGIGGGKGGSGGTCYFSGGSINASSVSGTPVNNSSENKSVYLTTVTLPLGTAVSALSIQQSGSAYSYGATDMQADSNKKLYLYLPEDNSTTADITMDGTTSYTGYNGTVTSGGANVLKMDQASLSITGINASYIYGDTISPSASGGSGTGAVTYNYKSGDGATDYGSIQPAVVGNYKVTATKVADASYYDAITSSIGFSIEQKNISTAGGLTVSVSAQTYTGSQITPSVTVTDGGTTLGKDTDYTVSYGANTNAGTDAGSVTVTGMGNYAGSVTKTFAINKTTTSSSGGGSATTYYTVSAGKSSNGTITLSASSIAKGGHVTVTITPDKGYRIADVLINGVSVGAVSSYTIKGVSKNTTVKVAFEKVEEENAEAWINPYSDVEKSTWYYDSVSYVSRKGLMNGDGKQFNPDDDITRAMVVTVLIRLSGDTGSFDNTFSDVYSGTWYEQAVSWASINGIASGVGGNSFAPQNALSLEQLAVMLYRYAKYKVLDVTVTDSGVLDRYSDTDSISVWAQDAMNWAVSMGVVSGDGTNLTPQDTATRAQIAVMLQRFIENVIG